jgi:hypothetical protein
LVGNRITVSIWLFSVIFPFANFFLGRGSLFCYMEPRCGPHWHQSESGVSGGLQMDAAHAFTASGYTRTVGTWE